MLGARKGHGGADSWQNEEDREASSRVGMGARMAMLLRERRDMAWGAGCLICARGGEEYGLLWWAEPVSFLLPLIVFFFPPILLCCYFSSFKLVYGVTSQGGQTLPRRLKNAKKGSDKITRVIKNILVVKEGIYARH